MKEIIHGEGYTVAEVKRILGIRGCNVYDLDKMWMSTLLDVCGAIGCTVTVGDIPFDGNVGDVIKEMIRRYGTSQRVYAKRCGMDIGTIKNHMYRKGIKSIKIETMKRLCFPIGYGIIVHGKERDYYL